MQPLLFYTYLWFLAKVTMSNPTDAFARRSIVIRPKDGKYYNSARRRKVVFSLRGGSQQAAQINNGDETKLTSTTMSSDGKIDCSNEPTPMFGVLVTESKTKRQYNWREFFPRPKGSASTMAGASVSLPSKALAFLERQIKVVRWFMTGTVHPTKPTESQSIHRLTSLARLLTLLREYEHRYGEVLISKNIGGMASQKQVLADITQDLYSSGTPTWVLETVMGRVAEGLTGQTDVSILLLPRCCLVHYPENGGDGTRPRRLATTDMFPITPGFDIAKMGAVEQVAVRLASFASNTRSMERLDSSWLKMPSRQQLNDVKDQALKVNQIDGGERQLLTNPDSLAKEILNVASSTYGPFFYNNSPRFQAVAKAADSATLDDDFWQVDDSTLDVFSRLAAQEAAKSLQKIRREVDKEQYSPLTVSLFRIFSSAGACAMWFGGGVPDMLVSGALAVVVAYLGTMISKAQFAFEERMLMEMVSSIVVGVVAGLLSLRWPSTFSFGAIAVASIMDYLQGFKVVYAVIEVMSKNIVAGTSRLLEGIMFTGLVSYSLKFGLDLAFRILGKASSAENYAAMLIAGDGINPAYFTLILPFAALGWSGLFRPSPVDLPLMAFHGVLSFWLNWAGVPMFMAAMAVTFSAGLISRFTGREALGNTLAGLYALVPGTYMVRALLSPSRVNFIETVLFSAATIGLGGWTGSLLCSPTILGKSSWSFRRDSEKKKSTMLYF
ncbi:putative threonine/serine exporter [Nitzschia inconspicua]|uniref:Threonine/serine exporter n=1 Tax=Nitzschia inconspicua TaxID=303405 RepID=A0A9K3LPC9_9STRA|nr:putative threonine/serine exporter [Nitzschia inconspicua]